MESKLQGHVVSGAISNIEDTATNTEALGELGKVIEQLESQGQKNLVRLLSKIAAERNAFKRSELEDELNMKGVFWMNLKYTEDYDLEKVEGLFNQLLAIEESDTAAISAKAKEIIKEINF